MSIESSPILISGFYRSGTTLLRRLLDAHSAIYCGPQIKFFANYHSAEIDDPLAANRLFQTLRDQKLDEQTLLRIWGKALLSTYAELASSRGKRRWADKNPDNLLYLDSWEQLLGDGFKLVHLIRNPVDALASLQQIGFEHTVPQDFGAQVALYQDFNDRAFAFRERHPDRIYLLTYENLVRQPEESLQPLFAFLGESFEPRILSTWRDPARGRGLEDPKIDLTDSIETAPIGRGQEILTEQAVAYIEQNALPSVNTLLRRAGLETYSATRLELAKEEV